MPCDVISGFEERAEREFQANIQRLKPEDAQRIIEQATHLARLAAHAATDRLYYLFRLWESDEKPESNLYLGGDTCPGQGVIERWGKATSTFSASSLNNSGAISTEPSGSGQRGGECQSQQSLVGRRGTGALVRTTGTFSTTFRSLWTSTIEACRRAIRRRGEATCGDTDERRQLSLQSESERSDWQRQQWWRSSRIVECPDCGRQATGIQPGEPRCPKCGTIV